MTHLELNELRRTAVKARRTTRWRPYHAVLPNGLVVRASALSKYAAADLFQSPCMDDADQSTQLLIHSYASAALDTTRVIKRLMKDKT